VFNQQDRSIQITGTHGIASTQLNINTIMQLSTTVTNGLNLRDPAKRQSLLKRLNRQNRRDPTRAQYPTQILHNRANHFNRYHRNLQA
jgi:hypothetical protein